MDEKTQSKSTQVERLVNWWRRFWCCHVWQTKEVRSLGSYQVTNLRSGRAEKTFDKTACTEKCLKCGKMHISSQISNYKIL